MSKQYNLALIIKEIAQAEIETEQRRQRLARKELFEPYTAFKRVDQERSGQISLSMFKEFLDDCDIVYNENECVYAFKRLDRDRDGNICYKDFNLFVLPKQNQQLNQLATIRNCYPIEVNMRLPVEIEKGLGELFQQEILNYRRINEKKQELVQCFDCLEGFKSLDLFMQGFIDQSSLLKFMKQQDIEMDDKEVESFFKGVYLAQNNKINYNQLIETISLMEPLSLNSNQSRSIQDEYPFNLQSNYAKKFRNTYDRIASFKQLNNQTKQIQKGNIDEEIERRCMVRLHNLERLRYKQQVRELERNYDYLKCSIQDSQY